MITFLVLVMGAPFRIDYFFLYQRFRTDNTFGWSLSFLSILNTVFGYPLHPDLDLHLWRY
jgi:hypothetical protein